MEKISYNIVTNLFYLYLIKIYALNTNIIQF